MAMVNTGYSEASPRTTGRTGLGNDPDSKEYWSLSKCKRAYLDYVGSKQEEIQE